MRTWRKCRKGVGGQQPGQITAGAQCASGVYGLWRLFGAKEKMISGTYTELLHEGPGKSDIDDAIPGVSFTTIMITHS